MKKFLVLIVLITSYISPLDMTHPTMKTLIQQPSKILTDFQGEDASSTNSILYGRDASSTNSIFDGRDARHSMSSSKLNNNTTLKGLMYSIESNEVDALYFYTTLYSWGGPLLVTNDTIVRLRQSLTNENNFIVLQ